MFVEYLKISTRSLARRKTRSYLTMIGIFIGIAAVVSLIGLGEGLRITITSQFGFLGTDILSVQASGMNMVGPPGSNSKNALTDDLADKISKVPGVEAAINRYLESGTLEFNNKQGIGIAFSIPSGEDRKTIEKMVNLEASEGRLLKDGDLYKVLLGSNFKNNDMYGKTMSAGDTVLISGHKFEIVGILEKKGSFMLDNAVAINDEAMLNLFGDDGTVSMISVKVKDEKRINDVKEDIEKLLRKERDVKKGEEDFVVESPQSMLDSLNSTLFAVQLFVYIIATISLLVGGIGIMNTMYTSVIERTKDIGIMKAIGARNSTIFTLFFIESGLLGMVGGTIGIIVGLIFAYGLSAVGRMTLGSDLIQAQVSPSLIIGALFFSFVVGTLAGVLPAIQAAKMQPVEALRYAK